MPTHHTETITTIGERWPVLERLCARLYKSHEILGLEAMLPRPDESPRRYVPQVSFYNHAHMFSWMVVPYIWGSTLCEQGFGDYRSSILFHPVVKRLPLLHRFARYLAGGYLATSARDVVWALREGIVDHFGTMPEGASCAMQYSESMAPFRFNGLLLIGLRAKADFLLVVHKGTEQWNLNVPLPVTWKDVQGIVLPGFNGPLSEVRVHFSLYQPSLTLEEVEASSKAERRRKIDAEGERMRRRMLEIYEQL